MNNNSIIVDKINSILDFLHEKMCPVVGSSLFLQRFDHLIFLLLAIFFISSLFISTDAIGIFAAIIVTFVVLKLLIVRGQNINITLSSILLFAYMMVCFISIFFSDYFAYSIKGFSKIFIYMAFYFSMFQFLRFNKSKIKYIIFILSAIVSFEALYAIIQSLGPQEINTAWQDTSYVNPEETLSRVFGTLENANVLCAYLIAGLGCINAVALMAFFGKHKKTFTLSVLFLFVTLIAIFLTGCRGGYIGLFLMFIVAFFLINYIFKAYLSDKIKKAWKKVCACFVSLGALAIIFSPAILKRITSIFMFRKDSSISFRVYVYESCWQMFKDNWFSGIGVGSDTFRSMYSLYMTAEYSALSAYCIYLEIALESGIFALLLFISYFVSIIRTSIQKLKTNIPVEEKAIIISIIIMLSGVFAHGFFDTVFFRPQVQFMFWMNMAILAVLIEDRKEYKFKPAIQKIGVVTYRKIGKIYKEVKNKWDK